MGLIAVDIVLLPEQKVMDMAIAQNRLLVAQGNSEIVLDHQGPLPHISLMMGCMDRRLVPQAEGIMKDAVRQYPPGQLTIIGIAIMTNRLGKKVSSFLLHKTDQLQALHEILLRQTEGIFSYQPQPSMIAGAGTVSQTTLDWIRSYRQESSLHRFWPHITLGYGMARPIDLPITFQADDIALCHLGDHCTCRQVLAQARLG